VKLKEKQIFCKLGIDLYNKNTRWDRRFKHVLRYGCCRSKDDRCLNWREEKKTIFMVTFFLAVFRWN